MEFAGGPRNPEHFPDYEKTPLQRSEYITAIVHLYRGELARATAWRIRLDTTTNWAVLTAAGLLAFSFRDATQPHGALLMGMMLVSLLLGYEARRYQMFDVWRARVRKIEENFYGPILRRNPVSPQREWGERVARDLLQPKYKISFLSAIRARLLRNYWAIYTVFVLAWVLKVVIHPVAAHSWADFQANLQIGFIPWWGSARLRRVPGGNPDRHRGSRGGGTGRRRVLGPSLSEQGGGLGHGRLGAVPPGQALPPRPRGTPGPRRRAGADRLAPRRSRSISYRRARSPCSLRSRSRSSPSVHSRSRSSRRSSSRRNSSSSGTMPAFLRMR